MNAQDCWIKIIPEDGAPPYICEHRVWDKATFIAKRQEYFGNRANEDERAEVVESTQAEYKAFRKAV